MTGHRIAVVCAVALACSRSSRSPAQEAPRPAASDPASLAPAATPVTAAPARRAGLAVRVTGPGETVALEVERVRAPFAGTLVDLPVQDGDAVEAGQVVGRLLSRSSLAALEGATAMARSATTPQERADAERALALARASQVTTALRATRAGVVLSHQAVAGGLVASEGEIVSIAATDAIVFVARIDQGQLARVRPGAAATVELPAWQAPVPGRVHAVLPATSTGGFSAPVRIDLAATGPRTPGLFGTASIVVAEVRDALVVPAAAVLRDDVTGTARVAVVTAGGTARWLDVTTGVEEDGAVQLLAPAVTPGTLVITGGAVGLPEGTRVEVRR